MTTITPPPPPQALPVLPAASPVVVVVNPPPALSQQALGSLLKATVSGPAGKDSLHLQTSLGQITIQTTLALPKGGALTLQLQALAPLVQLLINTVNGRPLPGHPRPDAQAGSPPGGPAAAGAKGQSAGQSNVASAPTGPVAAQGAPVKAGDILQASLHRTLDTPPGRLQPGRPVGGGAHIAKGAANTPGPLSASPTAAPTARPVSGLPGAPPLAGTASQPAGPTAGPPGRSLPVGSQLTVRISGIQNPGPGNTPAPANSPTATLAVGRSITGTVTGSTASGNPVIQTNAGILSLSTQAPIPRGAVLTLEVTGVPSGGGPLHAGQQGGSLFAERQWPGLDETIALLHDTSPATARNLVHTALPRPGAPLTNGLLFFMSALKGGDISAWIGDAAARLVETHQPPLLTRIADDFTSLSRIADEPATGDWRTFLIPINTGELIEQIRLLLRGHEGDDENDEGTEGTRFVVDVKLTRIGRLQLDGLVRHDGKKLDLIVRSDVPLPAGMNDGIRDVFTEATEQTGLLGGISFQAAPPGFIEVADPLSESELDGSLGLFV